MSAAFAEPLTCAGHCTLAPSGELDLATAPQLRQDLVDVSAGSATLVVLDLANVAFLDSVGLSVIIGGYKRLHRRGAALYIANPQPVVRKVLGLTRVDALIPTYDSVADAEAGCPSFH
jgi:anti-sigma B factor antagonist